MSVELNYPVKSGRHIDKHGIQYRKGSHTLHDNNGSGNDNGIVPSLDIYADFFAGFIYRLLGRVDGGRWFYMGAYDDGAAIADTA